MEIMARARHISCCVAVSVVATSSCCVALADATQSPFGEKYSFSAGGFFTDHDTNIRLDTEAGRGTLVNLEDNLGLDATTDVLRVNGAWRFADRHKMHLGLFDLSQSGSRTLETELTIDGQVFEVNEVVATDWKMRLLELGYSYRIRGDARFQWWFNVAFFVQDTAINVTETATGGDTSSEDVILPLPKFGTAIDYAFTDRWIGHAGIDVFKLEIGDYAGSLVDFRATLDYRLTQNVSLGAGWHLIDVIVDLDRSVSGWRGRFDWQTRGFLLYGRLVW